MNRLLAFVLALPLSTQAIVIDNGVPPGTERYWAVDVLTGGATQRAEFTTGRYTENVVSSYHVFVDPGIDGQGFELIGSEPEFDMDFFNTPIVRSNGSFIGANGNTVQWSAESTVFPGSPIMSTTYSFASITPTPQPIGPLRVYFYLDGDIHAFPDNDVAEVSVDVVGIVKISTIDDLELFGVSHISSSSNATFAGLAVDRFDLIRQRIEGAGQPVSPDRTLVNLPQIHNPSLGSVYGPANIVSVLARDVNPTVSTAVVSGALIGQKIRERIEEDDECFIEVETDTCEGTIVPVRRQLSCQGAKCKVEVACNQAEQCPSKVEIFVTPPSTSRAALPPRPIRFAASVANIPPRATALVRPKLTKRGKTIFRANRRKTIRGVMQITNTATDTLVTRLPVRLKLK